MIWYKVLGKVDLPGKNRLDEGDLSDGLSSCKRPPGVGSASYRSFAARGTGHTYGDLLTIPNSSKNFAICWILT